VDGGKLGDCARALMATARLRMILTAFLGLQRCICHPRDVVNASYMLYLNSTMDLHAGLWYITAERRITLACAPKKAPKKAKPAPKKAK
jgi:hypothetical protein